MLTAIRLLVSFLIGFYGGGLLFKRGFGFVQAILIVCVLNLVFNFIFISIAGADTVSAMQKLRKTAVMVNGSSCSGSGGIVQGKSGKHYLLTNAHVCNCASWLGYVNATFEGGELIHAKVVKKDWSKDLCAARVEDSRDALSLAPELLPLTEVNTRGYPTGRLTESHGVIKGNVEWVLDMELSDIGACPSGATRLYAPNGNLSACELSFTSTVSNLYGRPGSSGSPVVNDNGELVGVISSWHPGNDYDAGQVTFQDTRDFLSGL